MRMMASWRDGVRAGGIAVDRHHGEEESVEYAMEIADSERAGKLKNTSSEEV